MTVYVAQNFNGASNPYSLDGGDQYYLNAGISVSVTGGYGVVADGPGNFLFINGSLSGGFGAFVTGDNHQIAVGTGGAIIGTDGDSSGVYLRGAGGTLTNRGQVIGDYTAVYVGYGGAETISNYGQLQGLMGVFLVGQASIHNFDRIQGLTGDGVKVRVYNGGQNDLTNSGTVVGQHAGIWHDGSGLFTINNSGSIVGRTNSGIQTNEGRITLTNTGTIQGAVLSFFGDVGVDTVINKGTMKGNVNLSGNNDVYEGSGGKVVGSILGSGGADTLRGGAFTDVMNGGQGGDVILGRGGRDDLRGDDAPFTLNNILYSFPANDTFDYNAITDSGPTATTRDIIRDFNFGNDKIDLSTIDARTDLANNQAFALLARDTSVLHNGAVGAGKIGWYWVDAAGTANDRTILKINNDADAAIEMQIELVGLKALSGAAGVDFVF